MTIIVYFCQVVRLISGIGPNLKFRTFHATLFPNRTP